MRIPVAAAHGTPGFLSYLESPSTTASIPLSQHEPRGVGLTGGTDLGAGGREMDGATPPPPPPAAGRVAGADPMAGGRAVRLPAVARFVCPFPGLFFFLLLVALVFAGA
jgi:hypothetical protein